MFRVAKRLVGCLACVLCTQSGAAYACDALRDACFDRDARWRSVAASKVVGQTDPRGLADSYAVGIDVQYVARPLRLQLPSPTPFETTTTSVVSAALDTELLVGYQLRSLLAEAALGATLWQSGGGLKAVSGGSGLPDMALRDARIAAQWTAVGAARESRFSFAPRIVLSIPTGTKQTFRTEGSWGAATSVLASARFADWHVDAEAGLRARPRAEHGAFGVDTAVQAVMQLGVSRSMERAHALTLSTAVFAAPALLGQRSLRQQTDGSLVGAPLHATWMPAEWSVGAQACESVHCNWRLMPEFAVALPLGSQVLNVAAAWRASLGIRWTL